MYPEKNLKIEKIQGKHFNNPGNSLSITHIQRVPRQLFYETENAYLCWRKSGS